MDSDKSQQNVPEYGFGEAKHFMPLPNTVVGSHCAWEIRLNTISGRIPGNCRDLSPETWKQVKRETRRSILGSVCPTKFSQRAERDLRVRFGRDLRERFGRELRERFERDLRETL